MHRPNQSVRRALLLPLFSLAAPAFAQCPAWTGGFEPAGPDGTVRAMVGVDEGAEQVLYLGGEFSGAEGVLLNHVARWNGTVWSPLSSGMDGPVLALALHDDGSGPALYAAGAFTEAGGVPAANIARWNGSAWSPLGAGLDATATSLAVYDDGSGPKLFAGGEFANAGGAPVGRIARWDGASWSALGAGTDAAVNALAAHAGRLYVGGDFAQAGGASASRIASWDGSVWSALGSGTDAQVLALASYDAGSGARLYAGGSFTEAGGITAPYVATWDGASWADVLPGPNGIVWSLAVFVDGAQQRLVAGGDFTGVSGMTRIGVWNGIAWQAAGGGVNGRVYALAQVPGPGGTAGELHAGGDMSFPVGAHVAHVASLHPSTPWQCTGRPHGLIGVATAVRACDLGAGPELYVGGIFTQAGATQANRIATWNGTQWGALGSGLGGSPANPIHARALEVFDTGSGPELYVGGSFTLAGGTAAHGIARWNGTGWRAVGGGVGGFPQLVDDLAVYDAGGGAELFVAGSFSSAGGVPSYGIARWDGASWYGLGTGVNGYVAALAVHDDGSGPALYAGGQFTTADGAPALHIARWNGSSWSPVGTGLGGFPHALATFDDGSGERLFAATSQGLFRWDAASWTQVAPLFGFQGGNDLAVFDDGSGGGPALYIVGSPTSGAPLLGIARWTGNSWAPLDLGLGEGSVSGVSLDVFDDGGGPALYVGGSFRTAGGRPSQNFARWKACGPVSSFCSGDGADAHVTTVCPCGNSGGPGRGCAWHNGPTGALLEASGAPNPDTLVLSASGMPASAPSTIFLKGDVLIADGVVFGDGVRCAGGSLIRLGTKANVNGAAQYPEPGNPSISVRGVTPPGSGAIGYYQTYYRNAAAFCTSDTFNVTNAVRVVW